METTHSHIIDFKDKHLDQRMVIAGCGPSAAVQPPLAHSGVPTIGVNDSNRYVRSAYLVVVDALSKFHFKRQKWIKGFPGVTFHSEAHCSELGQYVVHSVPFKMVRSEQQSWFPVDGKLRTYKDSAYVAMQLALWMGASEIGFIGVDHVGDHPRLRRCQGLILNRYGQFNELCKEVGIRLVKLSELSKLPFEYVPYEEWVSASA